MHRPLCDQGTNDLKASQSTIVTISIDRHGRIRNHRLHSVTAQAMFILKDNYPYKEK